MLRFLFIFFLFTYSIAHGQDPRFSQYFTSPLTLNPALTANIDGTIRLAALYRNQWRQLGFPYNTGTISADARLLMNKINESNRFGIGAMFMYDESFASRYKINYAAVSTAYHQSINYEGTSTLGIGIQAVYSSQRVNFSKLNFANQFTNGGFDNSLPTGESFQNDLKPFFDVNAGLLFNHRSENYSFYLGGSAYNISSPVQSLAGNIESELPSRYIIHGGGNFNLNNESSSILCSFSAMRQAGVNDINLGAAYGFSISGSSSFNYLYVGGFYRLSKAAYPYVSLQTGDYQIGLSYDIELFDLAKVNSNIGSFELSFSYTRPDNREMKRLIPWY
jgi:type IX secretion system PorP/SprF family membrane protein